LHLQLGQNENLFANAGREVIFDRQKRDVLRRIFSWFENNGRFQIQISLN
jgi:hypothetical protein